MGKDVPKPGQKFPTPTPGFGDRVFYETLFRQKPKSAMAQEWCVHHGVLAHKEAEKYNKIVMARKKGVRTGDSSAVSPKKKKVKVVSDMPDPDMQISGAERVGSAII